MNAGLRRRKARGRGSIYFVCCIVLALALCGAQITGSEILIVLCLAAFVGLVCLGCSRDMTIPLLFFFLPWSPLLRLSPDSVSFYTIGLVLVCCISMLKHWMSFKRYHIVAGVLLLILTLLSKLLDGSYLAMDYIGFMMMITLFPVVAAESGKKVYRFEDVVVFLSAGIILASLCAQQFASYDNIARFIRVDSYNTIVRRCGFYGDPNFYTAQITAALAGCLILILRKGERKRSVKLAVLIMCLLYCGFLSGSKSFVLVVALMLGMWGIELLRMRGQSGLKSALIIGSIFAGVYIATSSLFAGLIDVLVVRFASASDLDSLTTGRVELWASYVDVLLGNIKVMLLGRGYTDILVNDLASHNTIIQAVYQVGVIGMPILIGWMYSFQRHSILRTGGKRINWLQTGIVLCGLFLPWMAIDILFFDEFFLWQWYMGYALQRGEDEAPMVPRRAVGLEKNRGK